MAKQIHGVAMAVILAVWLAACQNDPAPTPVPGAVDEDAPARAEVREVVRFTASDGVPLHAIVRGAGDLRPRPLIVEFSPYGGVGVPDFGPDYNRVYVHARGTGESSGQWSAVGPRDQQDVAEFLEWACAQPWSDGRIGLYGFSASAIAIYNALHLPLPCVEAAALMAGTSDLYRDLLYPGGIPNAVPALAVGLGVTGPALESLPARFDDPATLGDPVIATLGVLGIAVNLLTQPTLDDYWQARTQRPGPNRFPVLANTGFYDVESRGPFESYRMLREQGVPVHLRLFGAHDGFPAGTPGPFVEYRRWFDRFLLDRDTGIDREPRVQMLIGLGGYAAQIGGAVEHLGADDWPVPGTRWQTLYLDDEARLSPAPVMPQVQQHYLAVTSGLGTDPYTTATVSALGSLASWTSLLLTAGAQSLQYTTPPLTQDVDVVGPASLVLHLSSALPEADIHAVLSDVWPDGSAHPVGAGRLRSSFPAIVPERTRYDVHGEPVQPYPDFSAKTRARPGQMREYAVEFWPIGNRFQAGHRLRVSLVSAPTYNLPMPGVLNTLSLGGDTPSRLLLPVLPGSDLCAAIGASC
ncbi:CocE/NonD family hydrolase [Sinimarinibacterium sp. NLF-5-8]|uniref:CocE/NonD family hydrolase n=1 Tax=Sinimarinibacterium sp. NLF-5-8 TaxID=2698684 RepID=UPI00137BCDDC|nr:CocE/NonD family hydrolase [Sinimarinibacterium sp. NLF-5-8]QHS10566.1 CocE/NonD family hydrolase [Sinimarinibacterium sp. NLF-5-8]